MTEKLPYDNKLIDDSSRMLVEWTPDERERQDAFVQMSEATAARLRFAQGSDILFLSGQENPRQTLSMLHALLSSDKSEIYYVPADFERNVSNSVSLSQLLNTMKTAHVVFVDNYISGSVEASKIDVGRFISDRFWKTLPKTPFRPFAVSKHDFCLLEQEYDREEIYRQAIVSAFRYGPPLRSLRYGESVPRIYSGEPRLQLKPLDDQRIINENEWKHLEDIYLSVGR